MEKVPMTAGGHAALEEELNRKRAAFEDALQNAQAKGAQVIQEMHDAVEAGQQQIDSLYERWMELEEKTR